MEPVVNGEFLPFVVNYFCIHLCVVIVLCLLYILNFLAIVGFKLVQIGSLKQIRKQFDEFLLFLRAAAPPRRTERTLGYLTKHATNRIDFIVISSLIDRFPVCDLQ